MECSSGCTTTSPTTCAFAPQLSGSRQAVFQDSNSRRAEYRFWISDKKAGKGNSHKKAQKAQKEIPFVPFCGYLSLQASSDTPLHCAFVNQLSNRDIFERKPAGF